MFFLISNNTVLHISKKENMQLHYVYSYQVRIFQHWSPDFTTSPFAQMLDPIEIWQFARLVLLFFCWIVLSEMNFNWVVAWFINSVLMNLRQTPALSGSYSHCWFRVSFLRVSVDIAINNSVVTSNFLLSSARVSNYLMRVRISGIIWYRILNLDNKFDWIWQYEEIKELF